MIWLVVGGTVQRDFKSIAFVDCSQLRGNIIVKAVETEKHDTDSRWKSKDTCKSMNSVSTHLIENRDRTKAKREVLVDMNGTSMKIHAKDSIWNRR